MVASVGGPSSLGAPGQWPVWPVVKTTLACINKNYRFQVPFRMARLVRAALEFST